MDRQIRASSGPVYSSRTVIFSHGAMRPSTRSTPESHAW